MIITIPDLTARVEVLAAKVVKLPVEKNKDYITGFRDWRLRWYTWRENALSDLERGIPYSQTVLNDWEKDASSWEQGYGFISTGIMPSSPPSRAQEGVKPMTIVLVSGILAVVAYFLTRR